MPFGLLNSKDFKGFKDGGVNFVLIFNECLGKTLVMLCYGSTVGLFSRGNKDSCHTFFVYSMKVSNNFTLNCLNKS